MGFLGKKAEIDLMMSNIVDAAVINHLREAYGLNPNVTPLALQFPRLPPGILQPVAGLGGRSDPRDLFRAKGERITPDLRDFRESYQRFASRLFDLGQDVPVPGHPMFSNKSSADALGAENAKLKKENQELKKQLGRSQATDKQSSQHNP